MSITERLANLSTPTVIITVIVLFAIRFVLLKQKGQFAKSVAEIAESLGVAMALVFLLIRPFIVQAFFIPSESMVPTLLTDDHILVNKFIYRFREPKLGDVIVFKAPPRATKGEEKDYIKRVIGVPGDLVRITPGYVLIGEEQYQHLELRSMLSEFSAGESGRSVRLRNGKLFIDGNIVSKAEIAEAAGKPEAKVKVVPGRVFINGKEIDEPYIAEDPDSPYPDPSMVHELDRQYIVLDKTNEHAIRIPKGRILVMGDNRNESNDARIWGLLERERVLGKAMFIFWPIPRVRLLH